MQRNKINQRNSIFAYTLLEEGTQQSYSTFTKLWEYSPSKGKFPTVISLFAFSNQLPKYSNDKILQLKSDFRATVRYIFL